MADAQAEYSRVCEMNEQDKKRLEKEAQRRLQQTVDEYARAQEAVKRKYEDEKQRALQEAEEKKRQMHQQQMMKEWEEEKKKKKKQIHQLQMTMRTVSTLLQLPRPPTNVPAREKKRLKPPLLFVEGNGLLKKKPMPRVSLSNSRPAFYR